MQKGTIIQSGISEKIDIADISNECVFFSKFGLSQIVFIRTDPEQKQRIVTEIEFQGNGNVVYTLTCSTELSRHYDFELSKEEDILKKSL